jgi:hypothetical protein
MDEFLDLLQENRWLFLVVGYFFTISIETPLLLVGLSPEHPMKRRIVAGFWLTACTYPIVILVLPELIDPGEWRLQYLLVAEVFAPVAECAVFWVAFAPLKNPWRDLGVITLANLASFGLGELLLHLLGMISVADYAW